MYSLAARYKYSLIIPAIFLAHYVITLALNSEQLRQQGSTQITLNTLYYISLLVVIYIVSALFFSLETLIRAYIADPQDQMSTTLRQEINVASVIQKLNILEKYDKQVQQHSVVRSVIFQSVLLAFMVYIATSSKSTIGIGITLSIYLQLLIEQIKEMRIVNNISGWFWQITVPVTRGAQVIYLGVSVIIFVLILLSTVNI